MTAKVLLLFIQPRDPATGNRVDIRLAGGGFEVPYRYDGKAWQAGIVDIPAIISEILFDNTDLGRGAVPQSLNIQWSPGTAAALEAVSTYVWEGAPFNLYWGSEDDTGTLPAQVMGGECQGASIQNSTLQLTLADPAAGLNDPIVVDEFAGTGDLEGPEEWEGRRKRRAWGRCYNLEGEPIDPANNIYCFGDPNRQWQDITEVRDKGAIASSLTTVAWQGTAAATFTALQGASAPQGGGVIAPSIACVKWWTQPDGILAADVEGETAGGYVETAAGIAEKIVTDRSSVEFVTGIVAAADLERPAPCGYVADDLVTSVSAALDWLMGGSSLMWYVDAAQLKIRLATWSFGTAAISVNSQRVDRVAAFPPMQSRRLGYRRNHRVHQAGDIAEIVTYGDGTPIDDLQPAAAGADPTGSNIASGIVGQGALATEDVVDAGGPEFVGQVPQSKASAGLINTNITVDGLGVLSGIGTANIPVDNTLQEWDDVQDGGGTRPTDNADVTAANTAAAIAGQGSLATLNAVDAASAQLTGVLPVSKADAALQNEQISYDIQSGEISGISPGNNFLTLGENLIPNAGLANSGEGWNVIGGGASEAAVTAGGANDPGDYLRYTGSAPAFTQTPSFGAGTRGAVQPGKTLYMSCMARCDDVTDFMQWLISYYDAAGNVISGTVYSVDMADTAWHLLKYKDTVPAGSARIGIRLRGRVTSGTYVDLSQPRVATTELQASEGGALGANIFLEDETTLATDADLVTDQGTAAGFLGQGLLAVEDEIGPALLSDGFDLTGNLFRDPQFLDESYWVKSQVGGTVTFNTADTTPLTALGTAKAAKIVGDGSSSGSNTYAGLYIPITSSKLGGGRMYVSFDYYMSVAIPAASYVFIQATCRDEDGVAFAYPGTGSSGITGADIPLNTPLRRDAVITIPDGTATVQLLCYIFFPPSVTRTGTMYVCNLQARWAVRSGEDLVLEDGTVVTDAAIVTDQGTAAGFLGQGALSTQDTVDPETDIDNAQNLWLPSTSGGGLLPNYNFAQMAPDGSPAGFIRVEGTGDVEYLSGPGGAIVLPGSTSRAGGFPAIPLDDKQEYELEVTHRSTGISATGLYIRLNRLTTNALQVGFTHIGIGGVAPVQSRQGNTDLVSNGAMPGTTLTTDTYTFTPAPGTTAASISFYNWGAVGVDYELHQVVLRPRLAEGNLDALGFINGPAEADADETSGNTAAGFLGQGDLSTKNTISDSDIDSETITEGSLAQNAVNDLTVAWNANRVAQNYTKRAGTTWKTDARYYEIARRSKVAYPGVTVEEVTDVNLLISPDTGTAGTGTLHCLLYEIPGAQLATWDANINGTTDQVDETLLNPGDVKDSAVLVMDSGFFTTGDFVKYSAKLRDTDDSPSAGGTTVVLIGCLEDDGSTGHLRCKFDLIDMRIRHTKR